MNRLNLFFQGSADDLIRIYEVFDVLSVSYSGVMAYPAFSHSSCPAKGVFGALHVINAKI